MSSGQSLALNAWQLTRQVHRELASALDIRLRSDVGLDLRSYEVLFYLNNAPDRTLRLAELTESLLLKPAAATRFFDRLERTARVRRIAARGDRRIVLVKITGKGAEDFNAARAVHNRLVEQHLGQHLTSGETTVLNAALDRVLESLRNNRRDPVK